uniref:Uncharacterized protein n=1 Tax=Anguilla anguilla TaxID=7936 RepID=A0A0E9TT67_ANGAN
MHSRFSCWA